MYERCLRSWWKLLNRSCKYVRTVKIHTAINTMMMNHVTYTKRHKHNLNYNLELFNVRVTIIIFVVYRKVEAILTNPAIPPHFLKILS